MIPVLLTLVLAGPVWPDAPAIHMARCQSEEAMFTDLVEAGFSVPVEGVVASDLADTFRMRRSRGRQHQAIDIMSTTGTPVIAIDDGVIVAVRTNALGGNIVEQVDTSGCIGFYYAHLDAWAPGLHAGQHVRRGDLLGFVGTTGNARGKASHLHLGAYDLRDKPGTFSWRRPLNPYPWLVARDPS